MTHFYVRACPEGHYELDIMRTKPAQLCRSCGAQLIDSCPECGAIIKDINMYGSSMMPPSLKDYILPDFCKKCGSSFPWAGKTKERVKNRQGR